MKINDVLNEGYYDNPSTSNATGQKYFVDSVTKQLNAYIDSVRKSGAPLQVWEFVSSYLTKYGWTANPQQEEMLKKLSKEVQDEYNYFLTSQEKPQAAAPEEPGSKAFNQMAGQLQQPDQSGANAFNQMANQLPQNQQNWAPSADSPAVWKSNRTGQPMTNKPATSPTWKPSKDSAPFFKSNRTGKTMNEGVLDWAKAKAGTMAGALASKMGLGTVPKLVNAMYTVGMTQHRDPRTGKVISSQQGSASQAGQEGTVDNPVLTKQTQQIIKAMTPMKGDEGYKDDLESIVRLALTNLYKTDPGDYSADIKRIMGQKPNQQAQQPQNPPA